MPSAPFDRRLTPARADLAAEHLRGLVDAPRYAPGRAMQIVAASAPLRRSPRTMRRWRQRRSSAKASPYTREQRVGLGAARPRPICRLSADGGARPDGRADASCRRAAHACYPGPSVKLPPLMALSLGARVAIVRHDGDFVVTWGGSHLCFAIFRTRVIMIPTSSRSLSVFSRRPICGAGGHQKGSTAPGLSKPPSRRQESLRRATAT